MTDRSTNSYTSPPQRRKTKGSPSRLAAGAGVAAAAVGLAWLLAPGFSAPKAPPSVPAEPSAGRALAMPEHPAAAPARAGASAATAAALHAEESAPATASVEPPAWVKAIAPQSWTWPRRVGIHSDEDGLTRRLIGWFPANAAGKQMLFLMTAGREETRLYEDEIPAFEARRAAEAEARRAAAEALARQGAEPIRMTGEEIEKLRMKRLESLRVLREAASAKIIKTDKGMMAEFTYADGRKEVVPFDPLVFDLKGKGIKTTTGKVLFDLYGYGKADKTQWMNDLDDGTGILVFDAKRSGQSGKDGSEVFGDRTDLWGVGQPSGLANGFEALRALVEKAVAEGVLRQEVLDRGLLDSDALASLEKAYGLRMKVGGFNREPVSLSAAGVSAIALSQAPTQRANDFDGQSNDLLVQPGAVFLRNDGTTGTYMNVWLKAKIGNLGLKTVTHLK